LQDQYQVNKGLEALPETSKSLQAGRVVESCLFDGLNSHQINIFTTRALARGYFL